MNERIKELAEQAGYLPDMFGIGHWDMPECQKFAELIVRECIEQASIGNGHGNNQWDRALTFASKNIKEHFGVDSA